MYCVSARGSGNGWNFETGRQKNSAVVGSVNSRIRIYLVLLLFPLGICWVQSQSRLKTYGQKETQFEEPLVEEFSVESLEELVPVEGPIDPDSYILGPGDMIGVNIITTESVTFTLRVNPTGDLLIPSVGILRVSGLTLSEATDLIQNFVVMEVYRNSLVDATLVGLRRFRVLVVGAVQEPGFVTVTPADRLTKVIEEAGGLHKYANEEEIMILHHVSGNIEKVSLRSFLLNSDLGQNPTVQEHDRIEVPFLEEFRTEMNDLITYNESAIFVTGFVKYPGAFRYFPGYSVKDYIGIAGGILNTGSEKSVEVYRSNWATELHFDDYVRPGDTIHVPENLRSRLFGDVSLVQTTSAILTIYLSYLAATRKR